MAIIIILACVVVLFVSITVRVIVTHPVQTIKYVCIDVYNFIRHKLFNICPDGRIIAFCGLFGKGKTLSMIHKAVALYDRYNDKIVWDAEKGFIRQYVQLLSNVSISDRPFVEFRSLSQIVDIAEKQKHYDDKHNIRTVTIALIDEASVQCNSRNFKSNFDMVFINSLLTCRHHHIMLMYSAQRFNNVDKLLRDVTSFVYDCNKVWRVMVHRIYDAWDLENTSDVTKIKPLKRQGWFIRNSDYRYNTLSVVDNFVKDAKSGDMISETDILTLQGQINENADAIQNKSFSYRWKNRKK